MPKLYCLLLCCVLALKSLAQQPPRALWSGYIHNAYVKPPVGDKDQLIYDAKRTKEGYFIIAGADTGVVCRKTWLWQKRFLPGPGS